MSRHRRLQLESALHRSPIPTHRFDMDPMEVYETLPIVPLRDVVVFPHMMMPFVIGRPSSTRALEHALLKDKRIFLAAQHDASVDDPRPEDIYTMGCVANVVQSLKLPDGNIKVLVEGVDRARAVEWKEDKGFYRVVVKVLPKQREAERRRREHDEPRRVAVRAVREAVEQPALRRDDCRRPRGRSGQARRHDRRAPAGRRRREAEPARDHLAASSASTASPASSKSRSTSSRSIAASSLASRSRWRRRRRSTTSTRR